MSKDIEGEALAAALAERGIDDTEAHEAQVREQIRAKAEALRGDRPLELDDPDRKRGSVVAPTGAFTLEGAATRAALELLALEERDKAHRQELRRRARGRGGKKLPPVVLRTFIPDRIDTFTPVHPIGHPKAGQPYGDPGKVKRWVRDKELDGQPTMVKVQEYESWGGTPVMNEHGKPITGPYGRYMELPGERYGHRVIRNSHEGTFNHDEYLQEQLYDLADAGNQEAGRQLVSTYIGEEHGDRSI